MKIVRNDKLYYFTYHTFEKLVDFVKNDNSDIALKILNMISFCDCESIDERDFDKSMKNTPNFMEIKGGLLRCRNCGAIYEEIIERRYKDLIDKENYYRYIKY
jgi:hypothetical protein